MALSFRFLGFPEFMNCVWVWLIGILTHWPLQQAQALQLVTLLVHMAKQEHEHVEGNRYIN